MLQGVTFDGRLVSMDPYSVWYKLDKDKNPVPCDIGDYGIYRFRNDHRVGYDKVDDKLVSTVFLGLDHNHGEGEPVLFETGIRDDDGHWDIVERYTTWKKAKDGHKHWLQATKLKTQR